MVKEKKNGNVDIFKMCVSVCGFFLYSFGWAVMERFSSHGLLVRRYSFLGFFLHPIRRLIKYRIDFVKYSIILPVERRFITILVIPPYLQLVNFLFTSSPLHFRALSYT